MVLYRKYPIRNLGLYLNFFVLTEASIWDQVSIIFSLVTQQRNNELTTERHLGLYNFKRFKAQWTVPVIRGQTETQNRNAKRLGSD